MWVKSEYAGELAVLSAWISALLPWNVMHSQFGDFGSTLFLRFPFFQVQYTWLPKIREDGGGYRSFRQTGIEIVDGSGWWVADPLTATFAPQGIGLNLTSTSATWAIGSGILALAVVLSFVMYFFEDRVEEGPVDPVRLMGGLLGASALVLSLATVSLFQSGLPGIPLPIGVLLMWVLAGVLLTVDRREFDDAETAAETETAGDPEA